ncbi:hypothetical protein B0H19DRAFT_1271980 [Mycena capillaripes]|nr:hypothetical protein B0H19DRAFT_1271980 [Mycena capillaripes]
MNTVLSLTLFCGPSFSPSSSPSWHIGGIIFVRIGTLPWGIGLDGGSTSASERWRQSLLKSPPCGLLRLRSAATSDESSARGTGSSAPRSAGDGVPPGPRFADDDVPLAPSKAVERGPRYQTSEPVLCRWSSCVSRSAEQTENEVPQAEWSGLEDSSMSNDHGDLVKKFLARYNVNSRRRPPPNGTILSVWNGKRRLERSIKATSFTEIFLLTVCIIFMVIG